MFSKYKLSKFTVDNRGLLLQLAYSWCHDKTLAEDIVQDATEKALKSISKIKNTQAIKAWFIKIMLNCWRDLLRKKQELQNIDELILNEASEIETIKNLIDNHSPEDNLSQSQREHSVQHAISCLPIKYRTVLTLIDIYGSSYSEVSQIIDAPIGTVMSRVSRAREAMRKTILDNMDGDTVIPIRSQTTLRGDE